MKVVTIGRSSQNEVTINDSKVSRHHCQIIQHDNGSFSLSDFGSTNGTYVNGKRVRGEVWLNPNDVVRIGDTTLQWRSYFKNASNNSPQKNNIYMFLLIVFVIAAIIGIICFLVIEKGNNTKPSLPNQYANDTPSHVSSDTRNINSQTPAVIERAYKQTKPDEIQISSDLIGHSLAEGKEDGYYPNSWLWKIEDGEVSNLRILSVEENSDSYYRVVISMRLSSNTRAFDCKAVVAYKLDNTQGWQIEMVKSRGMDIVKTHRYDDCVSIKLLPAFFFQEELHVINECDVSLEVGGRYLSSHSNGWEKFCVVVSPNSMESLGVFAESDFQIDYIERP